MAETYSKKLAVISKKLDKAENEFYKASSNAGRTISDTYEKTARIQRIAERREESYKRDGKTDLADALGRMVEFADEKKILLNDANDKLNLLEISIKNSVRNLTGEEIKSPTVLKGVVKMAQLRAKNISNVAKTIERYEPEAAAQLYEVSNNFTEIAEEAGTLAKIGTKPAKVGQKATEEAEA